MLIAIEKLKTLYPRFETINEDLLKHKLSSIESAIRSYTNNNFQVRTIRDCAYSKGNKLTFVAIPVFKKGDTVQISEEPMNNGVYTVVESMNNTITLDHEMYDSPNNLVTLVKYPLDVVDGAINVLKWDCFDREKVGIASETISRHSVSYQQYDGANTISGYPSMLFGFCKPYMRART